MRTIKFRVYTEIRPEVLGMKYFDLSDTSERNDTIMQFTGLLDKQGKEIYEGDIVVYTRHSNTIKAVIEWDSGCYYLRNCKDSVDSDTMNKDSMFFIGADRMEIIGNIYENPELLN